MTLDEAIRHLRVTPEYADLVRDAYFDEDVLESARRFAASEEFDETRRLLGRNARGLVLDLGAGRGIASYAFAKAGAQQVLALEPDPSEVVGLGALQQVNGNLPIKLFAAFAEHMPLPDESCDVVYARQVLHHIPDLPAAMHEVARVLKPGGLLLACREHVVDDERQLEDFLRQHPVHQLAGGENAYPLDAYLSAIRGAGLEIRDVMQPWSSIITAFPAARTRHELKAAHVRSFRRRYRPVIRVFSYFPGSHALLRRYKADPGNAGRLYAFLARKL